LSEYTIASPFPRLDREPQTQGPADTLQQKPTRFAQLRHVRPVRPNSKRPAETGRKQELRERFARKGDLLGEISVADPDRIDERSLPAPEVEDRGISILRKI
jgi:hypothetical protein